MTDKEYNYLMELLDRDLQKKRTKEEALQELINAGIFDKDGNYTEPYKILESVTKSRTSE